MKRFKLSSRETGNWWWVYIYDDLASMRKAATKHSKEFNIDPIEGYYDGALGLHTPIWRIRVDKKGNEIRYPNIGIIRLTEGCCSTEIVAHELIHAALHDYRAERGDATGDGPANFGRECSDREEKVAYIYGALFRDMNLKLHKAGIWS